MSAAHGAAQTATYVTTRDGCNGNPVARCLWQNEQPMSFQFLSQPNDYAFAVLNTSTAPLQVLGFEMFTVSVTNATEVAPTYLYSDASGPGATVHTVPANTPIATGSISVSGFQSWWSTSVYPPPVVQPGEAFWIGFNPQSRIAPPMNGSGGPGPAATRYRRPNINGGAWTLLSAPGEPAFRLRCTAATPAVPVMTALDLPRTGQQFRLGISGGVPFSASFLAWALNPFSWQGMPTPVNLAMFGVPDCFIYSSTDVALLLVLDAQGNATFSTVLPASTALRGVVFYNQAALAGFPNPFGLVTTNLGRGVVGS